MNTENNILIAEFMGYEIKTPQGKLLNLKINVWYPDNFKFDSDWNWLMEVVEKIESLKINKFAKQLNRDDVKPIEGHFWFQTCKDVVEIYASVYYWQHDNQIEGLSQEFKGKTKIEAVYNACVAFVKWYNEQQN